MGKQLFNRDLRLQIGALEIKDRNRDDARQPLLKVVFSIERSTKTAPNKAQFTIYNLSKASRVKIRKDDPMILQAGYSGFIHTIFSGQVRWARSNREGPNWVTRIEVGDGSVEYKRARINDNFSGGVDIAQVAERCAQAFGLDPGNLLEKVKDGSLRRQLTGWGTGGVISGSAKDVLSEILESMGLQWSIQDGQILVLGASDTIDNAAFKLQPNTGLIGSPEVGEKGNVSCSALLNGKLKPGKLVQLNALEVSGFFRVEKVVHKGDTWGGDWVSDLELKPRE